MRRALQIPSGVAALVAATLVPPLLFNAYTLYLSTEVLIFALAGVGLTVLMGWTGQIALAQAGLIGLGAYATEYLVGHGLPWVPAALIAAVVTAVGGLLVALPAVRLRGFYLAIATLAFGELLVQLFISAPKFTKGSIGEDVHLVSFAGLSQGNSLWFISLGAFVGVFAVLSRVGRTRLGRALRTVRDVEVISGSLGLSATKYKVIAFGLSAFLAGVAGALYAQLVTFLTPANFDLPLLIQLLVVVFVGGAASLYGPLIGAVFTIVLVELLQGVGNWQQLAYGAILVLVIRFLPEGIAGLPEVGRTILRRRSSGGATTSLDRRLPQSTSDAAARREPVG